MIEVAHFKQSPGFCGPASLKIVLSYYGLEKSESELGELCHSSQTNGTEPQDIVRAATSLGFNAEYKKNSSIEELKKLVGNNIPVIVDWFSPEQNGHYSVIIGFEDNLIIMSDPIMGNIRRMEIQQFLYRWFELDAYPPEDSSKFSLREIIVITK